MSNPKVTYVVPVIVEEFTPRFIETLYKYSEPDSFRLIIIDQVIGGSKNLDGAHLVLRPSRNLGYSKACNEGIIHGIHWQTPYICVANNDIEIMNKRWIDGIYQTFEDIGDKCMAVVPSSPRVAGWGYGVDYNPEILPYKTEYTEEDYDYLLKGDFRDKDSILPPHMPRIKTGVEDGAVFVMPYFKRECFFKYGLMDERFWPGSGEDYDYNARVYANGDRLVTTTKSWIWHHWSKSKDYITTEAANHPYMKCREYWNNMGEIWRPEDNEGHDHDIWGHYQNEKGEKVPLKRVPEIFVDQI